MAENIGYTEYEYDAFISYRHIPRDMKIAEKLHSALETYRVPKYLVKKGFSPRLKKIFRDREELPTSSDLNHDIEHALKSSRFLIVICSPEVVQSRWVLREVEFFGNLHGFDKILTLLVEGEPENSFPPGLKRYLYDEQGTEIKTIEPLAADIRPRDTKTSLKLLKVEKLRLIAGILGCKYDELRQRDHERRVKSIIAVSVSVAAFLTAFGSFTLWQLKVVREAKTVAVLNEKLASEAKDDAQESEQNALRVQSDLYASLARRAMDNGDRLLGISLAMEALPKDLKNPEKPLTQEARDALYYTTALSGTQNTTYLYSNNKSTKTEDANWCFYKNDDDRIVTVGDTSVRQYGQQTGRLEQEWISPDEYRIIAANQQADRAVIAKHVIGKGIAVQIWDIRNNVILTDQLFYVGNDEYQINTNIFGFNMGIMAKAVFSQDGEHVVIAYNEFNTSIIDGVQTSTEVGHVTVFESEAGTLLHAVQHEFHGISRLLIKNNDKLIITTRDENIFVYDISKESFLISMKASMYETSSNQQDHNMEITQDNQHFIFYDTDNILHKVSMNTGMDKEYNFKGVQISNSGKMVAFHKMDTDTNKDWFFVVDILEEKVLVQIPQPNNSDTWYDFLFSPDDQFIIFKDFRILNLQNFEMTKLSNPFLHSYIEYITMDQNSRYLLFINGYGVTGTILFDDPSLHEITIPVKIQSAWIQNESILLFENNLNKALTVRLYDTITKITSVTGTNAGFIDTLQKDADGKSVSGIVEAGDSLNIYSYSTNTGLNMRNIKADGITDFQKDLSSRFVLTNGWDGSKLINNETGELIRVVNSSYYIDNPAKNMHTVGFFPDGKHCWSVVDSKEFSGIVINDIDTGKAVSQIPLIIYSYLEKCSAIINSDGTRMLTSSSEGIQLWEIGLQMKPVFICKYRGEFLCTGESKIAVLNDNNIELYHWKTGQMEASIIMEDTNTFLTSALFIHDGTDILTFNRSSYTNSTKSLILWNCSSGKKIATLFSEFVANTQILDFGLINKGKEIAIVSANENNTYIKTIPFLSSFDEVYNAAKEKLHGRTFDITQDLAHAD